jgi:hypothetical protein
MRPISVWRAFRTCPALCVLLCTPTPARAQVTIVNDISLTTPNPGPGGFGGSDNWLAQGFTLPSSTSYTLTSIDLVLSKMAPIAGNFTVSLWSASGSGSPGSELLSIGTSPVASLPDAPTEKVFSAPSGLSLTQGATYFVVLTADQTQANSGVLWSDRVEPSPSTSGSGALGGWSVNTGSGWPAPQNTFPFQMAVVGSPVPEPQAYAVISGVGLVCFAALRKLRRHSA